jgi:hypothetical protein
MRDDDMSDDMIEAVVVDADGLQQLATACNQIATTCNQDAVNHPKHYTFGRYETIDVIEDWKLGYHLGNAVKYISRCEHKGRKVEDLKKAVWYIEREIKKAGG